MNRRIALALLLLLPACADDGGGEDEMMLDAGDDEGPQMFPANLAGTFSGSREGDVMAELTDETSFRVLMVAPPLSVEGEGTIDGDKLEAVLTTPDNPMFGSFSGTLDGDEASGEWSFATPDMDSGTWTALRE